ncbi:hypothetical protein FRB98_008065 [Tulasnella sp. 332]|nr:hypothetical protein FRB98_008065 [Tulasnella sp. 332]
MAHASEAPPNLLPNIARSGTHRSFTGHHDLLADQHTDFVHPVPARDQSAVSAWTIGRGTVIWRIWPAVLLHTLFAALVVGVSHETSFNLAEATLEEMKLVLSEKKVVLTLIEAFATALKHHLRGETSIYYTDLYPLLLPLQRGGASEGDLTVGSIPMVSSPPPLQLAFPAADLRKQSKQPILPTTAPLSNNYDYGTFNDSIGSITDTDGRPLLPSSAHRRETLVGAVSVSLIPFNTLFVFLWNIITLRSFKRLGEVAEEERKRSTPYSHRRHRPRVAGRGGNIPLVVIRALGEWAATLDQRGTGGAALGPIMGALQAFENSLTDLERLLTTPLPVVYSAHIRTVWLYLFFLPFQLSDPMGYFAVLAVGIAAFLYLGFLAAGEEIEEPFGYEENDLDLDLFVREIIHADIDSLQSISAANTYAGLRSKGEGDVTQGLIADACKAHQREAAFAAKQDQQDGGATPTAPRSEAHPALSLAPPPQPN